ncbi:MAG: GNAT family N-acetyltransferase [Chloroflexi bacterium]|nr:GNAT family N-acetyltransferase [Chloroflexota bacterium]
MRTARLILRPFRLDDLDAFSAFDRLPGVARYLYSEPRDIAASRVVLDRKIAANTIRAAGDHLSLAVDLADGGQCIGDLLLEWTGNEHLQGEIGYVFHPDHHGQGYATEACEALLRMGFQTLGLHRIVARCDARNDGSARVMERLGMRREALLLENEMVKGEWTDELVYALLDREWQARQVGPQG